MSNDKDSAAVTISRRGLMLVLLDLFHLYQVHLPLSLWLSLFLLLLPTSSLCLYRRKKQSNGTVGKH